MKEFFALLQARNIEFYRDRASLAWAFIFPLLVIIGCALAFSSPDKSVFRVGIYGEATTSTFIPLLKEPYIKTITFQQLPPALQRVQHHQLDLLISPSQQQYWLNPDSKSGPIVEKLLLLDSPQLQRQALSGREVRYVDWVIPGVLGMNIMFGALFGVGYVIVRYRQNGVLKRLQATPISALQFMSAQLSSRLLIVVLVNTIIFIGCTITLDLVVIGHYFYLLLVTILGAFSMVSVGLLVACRTANEELAGGLLNAATWPMLFLSEVWFSLDDAPQWMQNLSNAMPLTHIVKAFRAVMVEGASLADISVHLITMAVITVVCLLLATRFFRWSR